MFQQIGTVDLSGMCLESVSPLRNCFITHMHRHDLISQERDHRPHQTPLPPPSIDFVLCLHCGAP